MQDRILYAISGPPQEEKWRSNEVNKYILNYSEGLVPNFPPSIVRP